MIVFTLIGALTLFVALAFAAGAAYSRLRRDDVDADDCKQLPERVGRPEFTGYHTPPSRYMQGHPPEPGEPRAR